MNGMRDILFLPIFFLCLPVCFFNPYFGVLMWTVVSFLNPQKFMWGMAHHTPVAEFVAIPTVAGALFFWRGWRHLFTRDFGMVALLWLWFTFTTLNNTHQPEFMDFAPSTWFRWTFVSKVILMALLTAGMVNNWSRFRWLLLAISGSLGFLVLKAVPFMILNGGADKLYGPEGSMLADNNDLGLALNMTLPLFFFLAQTETSSRLRKFMGFMFVATIPAVLFTYSRGALVGMSAVVILMVLRLRQRVVLIPVIALAVCFAMFFTPEKWQHRMDFTREGAVMDASAMERLSAWKYSLKLALDHPLTGGGFEAFTPALYARYEPEVHEAYGPHSIYFGVMAEHGFPGLALYLCLIFSCFMSLQRAKRYGRLWGDERTILYSLMLQFSLLAFMITGAFLGRAYFDYFFTIVACTIILTRICKQETYDRVLNESTDEEAAASEVEPAHAGEDIVRPRRRRIPVAG